LPHGTPDWGLVGPKATTYGLDDLGEHAVRLGSPHLWDRLGDALVSTDFRNGFGPFTGGVSGLLASYGLVTGNSRQGAYSVRLTGGSTLNWYADIGMAIPHPVASGMGLEFSFSTDLRTSEWLGIIQWGDGTDTWEAIIEYDYVNKQLEYLGDDGLMHTFGPAVDTQAGTQPDSTMKMVVDQTLGEYKRVIFNDLSLPLMGVRCNTVPFVAPPIMGVTVRHVSVNLQNAVGYVDNVIITQNEP